MKSKTIALYGIWAALIFVTMVLETYVFTPLLPIAPPAVLSLATAFSLCVFADWKTGLIGGTIMGLCSLIVALMIGNPYFLLPYISVLPRMVAGVTAWGGAKLVSLLTKNTKYTFLRETLPYSIGGGVGVITNTFCVISMLALTTDAYGGSFVVAMGAVMVTNTLFELLAGVLLVPVIVTVLKRGLRRLK